MRRLWNLTIVLGVLAAACGAAGAMSAGGAAASTTDNTPIIVGGDGDLTISTGVAQGFEAGIYRFNKAGGLDGRKIDFVGFLDDGFSPQTNLTNAQQLVEDKHVTVVAPFLSEVGAPATGTFLEQNKVPFVGWAVNTAFTTAPAWGYGINGLQINPDAQGLAGGRQLLAYTGNTKTPSKLKVALIAENVAGAISANNALAGAFKYLKATVVYKEAPMAEVGTTNYAPYAQAMIASGANVAFETLDSTDAIGLAAALKAAGFKGLIVNGVTYFPGQLASQPSEAAALNGVIVTDEFPADENYTDATKQAQKDLAAVGYKPYLTSGASVGYWSAIVLEQMLRATLAKENGDAAKVTGATIGATVHGGFTYNDPIAGGIGPEYFPAATTIPTGCSTLLKTVGTKFKQLYPYQCQSSVDISTDQVYNQKTGKTES
ncbi:MAG: ABC transporter substrate-binding protein [Acidimicrobiales bacterium]